MTTTNTATTATETGSWQHPFEKAGLGKGPFKCLGMTENWYSAMPGHKQPAGTCQFCGTGIAYEFHIEGRDGRRFIVGIDCVKRTNDTQLDEEAYRARKAYERNLCEEARRALQATPEWQRENARIEGKRAGNEFRNQEAGYDEKQQKLRAARLSTFVGTAGQKVTVTVTVDAVIRLETAYGVSRLHIMNDAAGNRFVWFCSGSPLAKGWTGEITATVKGHETRDGIKQTILIRVKETMPKPVIAYLKALLKLATRVSEHHYSQCQIWPLTDREPTVVLESDVDAKAVVKAFAKLSPAEKTLAIAETLSATDMTMHGQNTFSLTEVPELCANLSNRLREVG